jgi:hypothetical protein
MRSARKNFVKRRQAKPESQLVRLRHISRRRRKLRAIERFNIDVKSHRFGQIEPIATTGIAKSGNTNRIATETVAFLTNRRRGKSI